MAVNMANGSLALVICRRNLPNLLRVTNRLPHLRHISVTGNPTVDKGLDTITAGKIGGWLKTYEDFVGLTEVREAQDKVIEAEAKFLGVQAERRNRQILLSEIHSKLKDIHAALDKVQRGDKRYLDLLTEEYGIIKEEKTLQSELNNYETLERDNFASLSSAVRESHEKERARTERTKYWSIMGSIIGVTLGIIGTSINNYLRMRELKGIVRDSAEGGVELRGLVGELSSAMQNQHKQIQMFVSDLKSLVIGNDAKAAVNLGSVGNTSQGSSGKGEEGVLSSSEHLEQQTKQILSVMRKQEDSLAQEMGEIKKILATSKASETEGNIVYVGPDMETMLQKAESNLEWKIKTNALWTVTFVYGAFALTLPILYNIFKSH